MLEINFCRKRNVADLSSDGHYEKSVAERNRMEHTPVWLSVEYRGAPVRRLKRFSVAQTPYVGPALYCARPRGGYRAPGLHGKSSFPTATRWPDA